MSDITIADSDFSDIIGPDGKPLTLEELEFLQSQIDKVESQRSTAVDPEDLDNLDITRDYEDFIEMGMLFIHAWFYCF